MLRKLSLSVITTLAIAGLMAQVASAGAGPNEPDPTCSKNGLPLGVYPPSAPSEAKKGVFDLGFNPSTHLAATEVTGGAVLCGTDPDAGQFYVQGMITFPNKGEVAR